MIKFNIGLNENEESEIAENIISESQILITKQGYKSEEKNSICLTNAVDDNNNPFVLTCEVSRNVNEKKDLYKGRT